MPDKTRPSKGRDIGVLFLRCQNLRWILIDEVSLIGAELFAELERRVSQAARPTGTPRQTTRRA